MPTYRFGASMVSQTPYETLNNSLVFENQDQYDWWHRGGPVLAKLMLHAKYNVHQQYQYLALFAHLVVPFLGPSPRTCKPNIHPGFFDLEFSQNFQQTGCITRIAFQPAKSIAALAERDPLKRLVTYEVLLRLSQMHGIHIDLSLYHHLISTLSFTREEVHLLPEKSRETLPSVFGPQNCIGLDLQKNGNVKVKLYTFLLGKAIVSQTAAFDLALRSVQMLDPKNTLFLPAIQHIQEYLRDQYTQERTGTATAGSASFHPTGMAQMACDLVEVDQSRIKLYLYECLVKFEKVMDIWTLGGRLPETSETTAALNILRTLWPLFNFTEGYHFPADMAPKGGDRSQRGDDPAGFSFHSEPTFFDDQFLMFNFQIRPTDPWPQPQVYFPLFKVRDSAVVDTVVALFDKLGWTEHASTYGKNVKAYYSFGDLHETFDLQCYLSFSFSPKTGPYTSIYYRRISG
ncbi:putative dimethylallyl tryptophan synthase [Aspergillus granulosus]|uniref:Dimethylallyl tryptophan synthase n=1 Tax=Aspergillus granulosus TaxID=176169 RepID=A0ABR4GRH6_9EURO